MGIPIKHDLGGIVREDPSFKNTLHRFIWQNVPSNLVPCLKNNTLRLLIDQIVHPKAMLFPYDGIMLKSYLHKMNTTILGAWLLHAILFWYLTFACNVVWHSVGLNHQSHSIARQADSSRWVRQKVKMAPIADKLAIELTNMLWDLKYTVSKV